MRGEWKCLGSCTGREYLYIYIYIFINPKLLHGSAAAPVCCNGMTGCRVGGQVGDVALLLWCHSSAALQLWSITKQDGVHKTSHLSSEKQSSCWLFQLERSTAELFTHFVTTKIFNASYLVFM